MVEVLRNEREVSFESLATKADLRELELKLSAELTLHKWMTGAMLAGVVSLVLRSFF